MSSEAGGPGVDASALEARLRREHGDLLAGVADCADRVAAGWDGPTREREAVVGPLRDLLADRGLLADLPALAETMADAADRRLPADPVAAPPYVVLTGRGPVVRAAFDDVRLVATLGVFDVVREEGGGRYVRADGDPPSVTVRAQP